jgi:hypothetical protein
MREHPEEFRWSEDDSSRALRRAQLMAALKATTADGRPDFAMRTKAARELDEIDAAQAASGSGRVTIYVGGLGPILREYRVDDQILKALTESLCLAEKALLTKAEPCGNRAASDVLHRETETVPSMVRNAMGKGLPG